MPNEDGTGPNGDGKMTGRKMGKCEGAEPVGRGRGRRCCERRGLGRGRQRADA